MATIFFIAEIFKAVKKSGRDCKIGFTIQKMCVCVCDLQVVKANHIVQDDLKLRAK